MYLSRYKALVRSHLEYGNSGWSPYKIKYIDALESVQRRTTHMLPGTDDLTYEERLRKLKLPTLVYRRLRGDMIEVLHGCYYTKASPPLSIRSFESLMDLRGHVLTLTVCRSNKKQREESFTQRVVKPWNSSPLNVVRAHNINTFKTYWINIGTTTIYYTTIKQNCILLVDQATDNIYM